MVDARVLAIVFIVLFSGFAAAAAAYDNAAYENNDVEFAVENWQFDEPVALAGTDITDFEATKNDTDLQEGTDYDLDDENGAITFLEGGELDADDEGARVETSYNAEVPEQLAVTLQGHIGTIFTFAGAGGLVVALSFIVASLAHAGRSI